MACWKRNRDVLAAALLFYRLTFILVRYRFGNAYSQSMLINLKPKETGRR
jgi:hypothetical protein